MTRAQFEDMFLAACQSYGVKVYFNDPSQEEDNGYALWNEVHLARKYSSQSVYMAVAFHELGHAISNMRSEAGVRLYKPTSSFNNEFNAWWLAQRLFAKHVGKPFTKKMADFMLDCLKSHATTPYEFKRLAPRT